MWQFYLFIYLFSELGIGFFLIENQTVVFIFILIEGGDCEEFLFFHFFVINFCQFTVLTLFFFLKNKDKLIKFGVFL